VAAFLDGRAPFTGIAELTERVLDAVPAAPVGHFADLYRADAEARERASELLEQVAA
jgi:1-deoxy-D-xylulose-5-phosphate reductoisomerase